MPSRLALSAALMRPPYCRSFLKFAPSHVLGTLPREQVSEFLSGLLIGAEVASMRDYVTHQHAITLVAGTSLDRALPASLSGDGLRRDGGGGRHGISGWYKEHRSCSGKLNFR
ncbi:2-dehydro-3-deoxygalactonokinase [Escherichia coli]|uniref:2-dehydro-3-deoxygalactonokinase n=1 Tax=Escherichia coli TaxID=562 RepID=A0A376TPA1_ECOLX|nr:2-dehydro-3-deoxygalactonokinase [Escherichia coli]